MNLEIIYQDNHLLVVNKPAGMLTQPNDSNEESLEDLAKEWIKTTYKKSGNVFLHAIHRLDRPVSGLVLFARTSKALSRLNASIREKSCRKFYLAEIEGSLKEEQGQLRHFLIHDHHMAKVVTNHLCGKEALLKFKVLERFPEKTLVEIELETGRYHQIRIQFSSIGHPLIGDIKYGAKVMPYFDHINLCHYRFEVQHPITNEVKIFSINRLPF